MPESPNPGQSHEAWRQVTDAHLAALASLTPEQRKAITVALKEWQTVAQAEGYAPLAAYANFTAEVDHSAALARLLSGRPLFVQKPELRYSYPDYAEMENLLADERVVVPPDPQTRIPPRAHDESDWPGGMPKPPPYPADDENNDA